ncbi:MAG: polysaccharide deacetylase family protein [Gallionellaceae bacterium]|nr:polysaccharide deacetylase family protein [Gallionellaceae bacterium]
MSIIPILMYHNIGVPPEGAKLRNLYVRKSAFARQMWMLRMLGYQGLSMSAAMPYLRGEKQGRVAVITFDDGYVDTLEDALPILQKNNFSATCYFISNKIGQYNQWDAGKLNVRKALMSEGQILKWHGAGMEVGAHSRTHPRLTGCTDDELKNEIAGSKTDLEKLIGQPVTQFCYPYGDLDERVVSATREVGYDAATTVQRGRARTGDNPMLFRRVLVSGSTLPHLFLLKLFGNYEDKRG